MRKALREQRKILGLCRDCGKQTDGFVLCAGCREKRKVTTKKWRSKTEIKSKIRQYKLEYKSRPGIKERETEYQKEYMQQWKGRPETRELINRHHKEKWQSDIQYKLRILLRTRLRDALQGRIKNGSAVRDLGCSVDCFKRHLESKFFSGMTWNNHGRGEGKWVIDHIIPLVSVDLTEREQLLNVCNYKNLRPMWYMDNIRKGFKTEDAWIHYQQGSTHAI